MYEAKTETVERRAPRTEAKGDEESGTETHHDPAAVVAGRSPGRPPTNAAAGPAEVEDAVSAGKHVASMRAAWGILIGAFAYALLRYAVFGETTPAQIPLFITNKALAAGAVVFLLLAGVHCVRGSARASRAWGRWALHTAVMHSVISLLLLSASYYPKFFGPVLLSLSGEISLLAAVLALYCFVTIGRLRQGARRHRALLAAVLAAAHILAYGYTGWVAPDTWHGGMPPVSLVTFLVACGAVVAYAVAVRRR